MNAIVDRVARAIRAAEIEGKRWERDQVARHPQFDELWCDDDRERYRRMACAALLSLTATKQMLWAGNAWQDHCSDLDTLFDVMITAALNPEDVPPYRYMGTELHPDALDGITTDASRDAEA